MARCELTGKGPAVKNLVSHSNIKTKSRNFPNVQSKKIFSRTLNKQVSLKMATSTIKSLQAMGGLDVFILNAPDKNLSKRALAVKGLIKRKMNNTKKPAAEKAPEAPVAKKAVKASAAKKPAKA
ncbi:MAG: 50S ribosomal protein L28 [Bdellovibrionales bacterium]